MLRERHYKNGHINYEGEVRDQINANKYEVSAIFRIGKVKRRLAIVQY